MSLEQLVVEDHLLLEQNLVVVVVVVVQLVLEAEEEEPEQEVDFLNLPSLIEIYPLQIYIPLILELVYDEKN
jgi:hypothetical protein